MQGGSCYAALLFAKKHQGFIKSRSLRMYVLCAQFYVLVSTGPSHCDTALFGSDVKTQDMCLCVCVVAHAPSHHHSCHHNKYLLRF
jgi:hypothetical protein